MTKKIFLGMSAMAMLFATSCKDDFAESFVGDQATVEFSISTPEIGTRAYSDGTTATKLQYAVYDAAGTELTALRGQGEKMVTLTNGKANVKLDLTTGESYQVIFWADAYGNADNAPYTVDFGTKTMKVNYNGAVSNDENRDAFYVCKPITVKGAQTETIELRRPFAQLNIGTEDYQKATDAGYTPTKSAVTVKTLGNTLNLWDGTVSGNPEEVIVNFDYADIVKTEVFPVDDAKYDYLAMNYLLVGADQEVVDIEFGYTETDATAAKTRTVGSVPVQRNYRTNIYGKLLTSTVDVNVEIVPDFNEPAHGLAALQNAALNGGEVTLTEDVVLTTPLEVYGKMTINLNGKTITGTMHKSVGHVIKNNGTLTISGGTISSTAANGGSAIQNNGNLVIEGTTLNGATNADGSWPAYTVNNTGTMTAKNVKITSHHGAVASYGEGAVVTLNNCEIDMAGIPGFTSHGIYTYNGGKVVVNGGTYENKATDQNASGASVINGAVEVNAGTFSGRIENYYGTPMLKGGSYTVNPKASFIAAGYKAIYKDSNRKYYVVPEEAEAVATNDTELTEALANGDVVAVAAGEYTFPASSFKAGQTLVCAEGTVFTGKSGLNINGATVIGATFSNPNDVAGAGTIHGTYKDCTFEGSETLRWCYSEDGKPVIFEDCVFKTDFRGVHFDGMNGDVIFRNCEINGFNAFGGNGKVTFEGCTFGNDKSSYNGLNMYTNIDIKDCKFNFVSGKTNFIDCEGTGKTMNITNSTATLDGAIADIKNFIGGSKLGSNTVVVDGTTL